MVSGADDDRIRTDSPEVTAWGNLSMGIAVRSVNGKPLSETGGGEEGNNQQKSDKVQHFEPLGCPVRGAPWGSVKGLGRDLGHHQGLIFYLLT